MKKIILLVLALYASASLASTQQQKLTVMLDRTPNTTHAPLIIAEQQGFFKEQGLNVQLTSPSPSSDSAQLIAENKADVGLTYEPKFIEQVDHGLPVIRIGTLIDKPLNCIVALQQSGIKTVADLKGKEIGSTHNPLTNMILTNMLEKQGVSINDIKVKQIHDHLMQALLANKVDAISGTMRNLEVPKLETDGHKLVVFFPEEHGIPNYSELVFITNTAHAQDPRFPRFLAAIKKAVRYLDEHPQRAWQAFAQNYPSLNDSLNREYWFATLPYFAEDPAAFDSKEWRHFADFMQQNKLIAKKQPVSRYSTFLG